MDQGTKNRIISNTGVPYIAHMRSLRTQFDMPSFILYETHF